MSSEPGREEASQEKPFRVSDYRDGLFQPSGHFSTERVMPLDAIANWEEQNDHIWDGKAWGAGQALFLRDKPLVFGRNTSVVDVQVAVDPDQDGNCMSELAVSRRHFELQPPINGKIAIKDLGSTNGVDIFDRTGKQVATLNKSNPDGILEEGYFTLFGGGPTEEGRLIGFRVCKDANNKLFLVKFNVRNLDDLLSMAGIVRSDVKQLNPNILREPFLEKSPSNEAISAAYETLVKDVSNLRQFKELTPESLDLLEGYKKLFADLFQLSGELGRKFYSGDWRLAASFIGAWATAEGEKHLNRGDQEAAAPAADLALLALDFSQNKLITFTVTKQEKS
ncbi:FHA domain-containing protein [Candidatus Daviesbacteria bacterium]|nr:FHA domain-containing protein [Candidatus Daviesbacteria bacterium]